MLKSGSANNVSETIIRVNRESVKSERELLEDKLIEATTGKFS